jgi:hypothetical protein
MSTHPVASNESDSTLQSPGLTRDHESRSTTVLQSNQDVPVSSEFKVKEAAIEVTWDGEADPENPKNWPKWKKWCLLSLIPADFQASHLNRLFGNSCRQFWDINCYSWPNNHLSGIWRQPGSWNSFHIVVSHWIWYDPLPKNANSQLLDLFLLLHFPKNTVVMPFTCHSWRYSLSCKSELLLCTTLEVFLSFDSCLASRSLHQQRLEQVPLLMYVSSPAHLTNRFGDRERSRLSA